MSIDGFVLFLPIFLDPVNIEKDPEKIWGVPKVGVPRNHPFDVWDLPWKPKPPWFAPNDGAPTEGFPWRCDGCDDRDILVQR